MYALLHGRTSVAYDKDNVTSAQAIRSSNAVLTRTIFNHMPNPPDFSDFSQQQKCYSVCTTRLIINDFVQLVVGVYLREIKCSFHELFTIEYAQATQLSLSS